MSQQIRCCRCNGIMLCEPISEYGDRDFTYSCPMCGNKTDSTIEQNQKLMAQRKTRRRVEISA